MKKFLLMIAVALLCSVTMAAENEVEIPLKKVPDLGLRTVNSYFPGATVVKSLKITSPDAKNRTKVILDNESNITFDKDGHWMVVDCQKSSVPTRMVPGKIQMYLNQNYPGIDVVYMGRVIKNGDITILLNNGTELHFTNEHTIIE